MQTHTHTQRNTLKWNSKKERDVLCHMCLPSSSHTCTTLLQPMHAHANTHSSLPVAKKRCVASSSWGEILTFSSFSASLKIEKSCCFLSWLDTLLFVRLSAKGMQNHTACYAYENRQCTHNSIEIFSLINISHSSAVIDVVMEKLSSEIKKTRVIESNVIYIVPNHHKSHFITIYIYR